jgi:hypothetical protein
MGQRNSQFRNYDQRANRKAAWTSLACGAALLSDGDLRLKVADCRLPK